MAERTCSVDGCESKHYVRGWCAKHYARWKKHGDPTVEPHYKGQCSIEGCERIVLARGWCVRHYSRWKRHGDPAIVLTTRHETMPRRGDPEWNFWSHVEKSDDCWNWLGSLRRGHGQFGVPGRKSPVGAHRFSYELAHGGIPEGMEIDHICRNRRCVNPDHLRVVTSKQNKENHSGPTSRSTSGVRGVYRSTSGKWFARVNHNGRTIHIGSFECIEDAEAAVIAKRNELFTHNDGDRSR